MLQPLLVRRGDVPRAECRPEGGSLAFHGRLTQPSETEAGYEGGLIRSIERLGIYGVETGRLLVSMLCCPKARKLSFMMLRTSNLMFYGGSVAAIELHLPRSLR